jgi:hypothetical protein
LWSVLILAIRRDGIASLGASVVPARRKTGHDFPMMIPAILLGVQNLITLPSIARVRSTARRVMGLVHAIDGSHHRADVAHRLMSSR